MRKECSLATMHESVEVIEKKYEPFKKITFLID
jgi:hypothetical protein